MTTYTTTVVEDPETNDIMIEFPENFLYDMGWRDGDTIEWSINDNGTIYIKKVDQDQLA
jgi:hypothetical protein